MKTLSAFLLVGLLVLWSEMSVSGTIFFKGKPGLCPVFIIRCFMLNPPNKCTVDDECPSNWKCCHGPCGRDCFQPFFEKFGTCPPNPFKCSVKGQDACNYDYDCQGIQKCCYFNCGKICRNPQEKAGSCPSLPFFCSVPEGDLCSSDSDCPEKKKCCYLNCGKSCVDP